MLIESITEQGYQNEIMHIKVTNVLARAANYQYIASLLASWKLQDKNIFEELENLLRQELCLSGS